MSLAELSVDLSLLRDFPPLMLEKHACLPLAIEDGVLRVGFPRGEQVDREMALDDLRLIGGYQVEAVPLDCSREELLAFLGELEPEPEDYTPPARDLPFPVRWPFFQPRWLECGPCSAVVSFGERAMVQADQGLVLADLARLEWRTIGKGRLSKLVAADNGVVQLGNGVLHVYSWVGELMHKFADRRLERGRAALSRDGRRLVAAGGNGVQVWDLPGQRLCSEIGLDEGLYELSLSADGSRLMVVTGSYGLQTWWLDEAGEPVRTAVGVGQECGPVRGICAERMLVWHEAPSDERWGEPRVIDLLSGRVYPLDQPRAKPHCRGLFGGSGPPLAMIPSSEAGIYGGFTVRIWELGDKAVLRNRWRLNRDFLLAGAALADDGRLLVPGDGLALFPGEPVADAPLCVHDSSITRMELSADGSRLASGSTDHTVAVFDVSSGTCVARLSGHGRWAWPDLSADGRSVAVNTDSGRWLHDLSDGSARATEPCEMPESPHRSGAQRKSPAGTWTAEASKRLLRVIHLPSGSERIWKLPVDSGNLLFRGEHELLVGLDTGEILALPLS